MKLVPPEREKRHRDLRKPQRARAEVPIGYGHTPGTPAAAAWLAENPGLVITAARAGLRRAGLPDTGIPFAALLSWAVPIVYYGFAKYRPDKGASLKTWVYRVVRHRAMVHFRGGRGVLFGCPGGPGPARRRPPILMGDYRPADDPDTRPQRADPDTLAAVRAAFEQLSPRRRQILGAWLGLAGPPRLFRDLAAELGLSREGCYVAIRTALDELREATGLAPHLIGRRLGTMSTLRRVRYA